MNQLGSWPLSGGLAAGSSVSDRLLPIGPEQLDSARPIPPSFPPGLARMSRTRSGGRLKVKARSSTLRPPSKVHQYSSSSFFSNPFLLQSQLAPATGLGGGGMVAPLSGGSPALAKSNLTHGIRQVKKTASQT